MSYSGLTLTHWHKLGSSSFEKKGKPLTTREKKRKFKMSQTEKFCRHHSNRTGIDRLFLKKKKIRCFIILSGHPIVDYAYLVWKIESVENDSQKKISVCL